MYQTPQQLPGLKLAHFLYDNFDKEPMNLFTPVYNNLKKILS